MSQNWNLFRSLLTRTSKPLVLQYLLPFLLVVGTGYSESALFFDGIDDHVTIPRDPSLNITNQITLEARVNWGGPQGLINTHIILDQDFIAYEIGIGDKRDEGHFVWFFDKVTSTAPVLEGGWFDGGNSLVEGWNHVAVTYNGANVRTYINGIETGNYSASGVLPVRNNPVHIGSRGSQDGVTPSSFYYGLIDEVRIWNTGRSEEEIQQFMDAPLTGNEAGLVGYWNFEEGLGQTANDQSAEVNHGRLGFTDEVDNGDPRWVSEGYEIGEENDLLVYNHGNLELLRFDFETGAAKGRLDLPPVRDYQAMALGPDGNTYVSSGLTNDIYRFDSRTGDLLGTMTSHPSLNLAAFLLFGPDDLLYVSNRDGNSVSRVDPVNEIDHGHFVSSGSGGLNWPNGLLFNQDGNLLVSSRMTGDVLIYDGTTGAFIEEFIPAGSGGLVEPTCLLLRPDGRLYVTDRTGNSILRYDAVTGDFIDEFIPPGTAGLSFPSTLLVGPDGKLYLSNRGTHQVLRFDAETGEFLDVFLDSGDGLNANSTILLVPASEEEPIPTATPSPTSAPQVSPTPTVTPGGLDQPPSKPEVAILPPFPTTLDDLFCSATGSVDPDGATVTYLYKWFRDGEQLDNETSFLSHEYTSRGQLLACFVTPTDGQLAGPTESDSVVIGNSLPTAPVIQILPDNPTPQDGLAAWILEESYDADGDELVYMFEWYESRNETDWNRRTELSGNLPFTVGEPEISSLYTQVAEYWRLDVTAVEEHTVSKRINGRTKGTPVLGETATDKVLIQPNLVGGSGPQTINAADLLALLSVWHETKGSLPSNLRGTFFEANEPNDSQIGFVHLLQLAINGWHRDVGE